jgi:hypothetical protein
MSENSGNPKMPKWVLVSIGTNFPGEITPARARAMGINPWQLSDVAIQEIEAIESNIRAAEYESGDIRLG